MRKISLKLILINERLVDGSFFDNCDLNFGIALAVLKGLVILISVLNAAKIA